MKKKVLLYLKNNLLYISSFITALITISIIYILNDVSPFGKNSLLTIDFYHQYGPLMFELQNRIKSFNNITYSFTMSGGLPIHRNFFNYLSSPINIIIFFSSKRNLLTNLSIIIAIKTSLSSLTMTYYLSKKFKSKKLYLIIPGILYSFTAYFQAYYWNIMWLDGIIYLPLITLGIENIINKNNYKFYLISLILCIFSNYYTAYMICLFSCLYFILYLIYKTNINKKELPNIIKKILIFVSSSLLAGLILLWQLIPLYYSLKTISATSNSQIPTIMYYKVKLLSYIIANIPGSTTTVFGSDKNISPNISCGIITIYLFITYILNTKIKIKNKICYLLILIIITISFFYAPLDFIVHGFHVTNDLPFRQSFIYSFILITIATYSLINIKKENKLSLLISYFLIMISLIYLSTIKTSQITNKTIYINILFLTIYIIIYILPFKFKKIKQICSTLLIIISCIEVIIATNNNWDISHDIKDFYKTYNNTEKKIKYIKKKDKSLFYRIGETSQLTLNDPSLYNYYGLTSFSSMNYEPLAKLHHKLGIPGNNINSYYYTQNTPIYNLMFNIKYFIGENNDKTNYKTINKKRNINKFKYNIGLLYGVSDRIVIWRTIIGNPFRIQNNFINRATGINDVLKEEKEKKKEDIYKDKKITITKYEYENINHNYLYFYSNNQNIKFIKIDNTLYIKNDYNELSEDIIPEDFENIENYDEEKIININPKEKITIYIGYEEYQDNIFNIYSTSCIPSLMK